jgi:hypothetical protein
VLRRLFGPKRGSIRGMGQLYSKENRTRNVYCAPNKVMMRRAEYVARMVEMRNACRILVGKREGKGPFGRSRHR